MSFSMGEVEPNAGVDVCHAIGVERRSGPEGVLFAVQLSNGRLKNLSPTDFSGSERAKPSTNGTRMNE